MACQLVETIEKLIQELELALGRPALSLDEASEDKKDVVKERRREINKELDKLRDYGLQARRLRTRGELQGRSLDIQIDQQLEASAMAALDKCVV